MRKAVVCGAGGFIGTHLVTDLKRRGDWVRGVDLKRPEFSETDADEFFQIDLRNPDNARAATDGVDDVYQLAADMGGMGFIEEGECEIMRNSALINIHMITAAAQAQVQRYFFTSSACVYPEQESKHPEGWMPGESVAYPALCSNEYGWEKLYAERMAMTYGRRKGFAVRICRIQNCYGPLGTWEDGREKAPAAMCRKVAMAEDGGDIEIWGDGSALRIYTYIDDMITGIHALMDSNITEPVTLGSQDVVSVRELVGAVCHVAGKSVAITSIDGPTGSPGNFHNIDKMLTTGWRPQWTLHDGLRKTYEWIEEQVHASASHSD